MNNRNLPKEIIKAYQFVVKVIDECYATGQQSRELWDNRYYEKFQGDIDKFYEWLSANRTKRIDGAKRYYAKVASQFENAPSYQDMVMLSIYDTADFSAAEGAD